MRQVFLQVHNFPTQNWLNVHEAFAAAVFAQLCAPLKPPHNLHTSIITPMLKKVHDKLILRLIL